MTLRALLFVVLAACSAGDVDPVVEETDSDAPTAWALGVWNAGVPATASIAPERDFQLERAVFHLHSPWSHDACDGHGWDEGVVNEACLMDLRRALCVNHFGSAFFTDHPDNGDAQPFEQLFHPRDGDRLVDEDGHVASVITCDDGHEVRWRAGFEDELMPVGLARHVDEDQTVRHALLNGTEADSFAAIEAAGGTVLMAHTEGRVLEDLMRWQDLGLHGIEAFNVHAMFSPGIRVDDLGLDSTGWITEIGAFTGDEATAEPDLFFLTVLQEQAPSIERWDALLARGPMMATAGTDAHQNVLPLLAGDGERVDGYRRMLRWFSTMLQTKSSSITDVDEAVAARRAFVVFEALGTPEGFDVYIEADGETYSMGSEAPAGTLVVQCPTLADGSPRGSEDPQLLVTVYRDGEPWQSACGSYPVEEGVYRVRIESVPHHLRPFLGDVAEQYIVAYPWIYSGALHVGP